MDVESLRFCAKYPFTQQARGLIESRQLRIEEVSDDYLAAAVNRVRDSLSGNASAKLREIKDSREEYLVKEVLSYPLSKIIVSLGKDGYLSRKYAAAEARKAYYFLQFEKPEAIQLIGQGMFGIEKHGERYAMPFQEYLASLPQGKQYKLVNQEMDSGRVLLNALCLAKVISERVASSILEVNASAKDFPKTFTYHAEELKKLKRGTYDDIELGAVETDLFPPCMKRVIAELKSGEKVSHYPRFVLVTFLAAVGMKPEAIIDLFRSQPNFNEQKTRYYVEHAFGGKGGGTKYSVPGCEKMDSYGICSKDDACRWKHPMSYYKGRKRWISSRRKSGSTTQGKA